MAFASLVYIIVVGLAGEGQSFNKDPERSPFTNEVGTQEQFDAALQIPLGRRPQQAAGTRRPAGTGKSQGRDRWHSGRWWFWHAEKGWQARQDAETQVHRPDLLNWTASEPEAAARPSAGTGAGNPAYLDPATGNPHGYNFPTFQGFSNQPLVLPGFAHPSLAPPAFEHPGFQHPAFSHPGFGF